MDHHTVRKIRWTTTEGEIFQSQLRAAPEEGAEQQKDDSEDSAESF